MTNVFLDVHRSATDQRKFEAEEKGGVADLLTFADCCLPP